MDSSAQDLRQAGFGILHFLASPDAQSKFAAEVYYADYAAEFSCWWFDDFAIDSETPQTDLIYLSFSNEEIILLQEFTRTYSELDANLGEVDRTIDELLDNPNWIKVIEAAAEVLVSVRAIATHSSELNPINGRLLSMDFHK
jgi:hypothetical protein